MANSQLIDIPCPETQFSSPSGSGFADLDQAGRHVGPSGNVRVADNWKEVPIRADLGGDEMMV
ncbi:hypothetical protein FXW78_05240 [Rhodococcus opacus]|nr:hypothetical protein [Rhodococcus opacus]RZL73137.1 MAG: hypothetical protein EOP32_37355 [Rhodococcus sp. (in: high G+C Gram-positive bacteria)]